MPEKIYPIQGSEEERQPLQKYVTQGKKSARAMNRARMLLLADEQPTDAEMTKVGGVNRTTISRVRKEYRTAGINKALEEKPRRGAPVNIDGRVEATLTMLACSDPPAGSVRWTLQGLAEKLVEGAVVESISLPTVRTALKKNERKPWVVKRWCIGKITGDYIWHMEDILDLYEHPSDPLQPVVCFDERPCQLLGDVLAPIPMKPGKPKREAYEYERQGTCCVLIAFEPLRSWRVLPVRKQRTAVDEALFMKELVSRHDPNSASIRLVQDHGNTQTSGSFDYALPPQEAFELAQKFESHSTPLKGRWLHMAEIALSALAQQGLNRRLGEMATFTQEATVWSSQRNKARKTVRWAFTTRDARRKLTHKYPLLQD